MTDTTDRYEPLATSRDRRIAERWSLVLQAKEIPHTLANLPEGWTLYVAGEDRERAERELSQYEQEERARRAPPPSFPRYPVAMPGLVLVLCLLALFHSYTYAPPGREFWLAAGRASAIRIGDGEWWRAFTALTLHSDLDHLGSNIVFGGVVLWALRRIIGAGWAWMLVLAAGAFGNVLNAWFYGSAHNSIGASTAVFGAVGVLSAVQVLEHFRLPRTRIWIPLAAGLALLAFLGTSERTDFMAHLFGFVAGVGVGLAALPVLDRGVLMGPAGRVLLSLFSLLLVLAAWVRALL